MKKTDKTFVIIITLISVIAVVSWNLYFREYTQEDTVNIHLFPEQIGEWTSKELPISDEDYAILETRNAFARRYTNKDGDSVMIFIVYSQTNRKVSHPPEICYTGSGATILATLHQHIPISNGDFVPVNKVLLDRAKREEIMYYWFKVGTTFTTNYWKQQLLIAFKTLVGKPSSSAMIRLNTPVGERGLQEASRVVEDFARTIYPELFEYLP